MMEFRSYYIGKIKISMDYYTRYHFGFTYIPLYRQFEINLGKYAINFWYRKEIA